MSIVCVVTVNGNLAIDKNKKKIFLCPVSREAFQVTINKQTNKQISFLQHITATTKVTGTVYVKCEAKERKTKRVHENGK